MDLSSYIDAANLKKDSTSEDIMALCDEAIKNHYASICVYPYYIKAVKEYLKDSTVAIGTVVGFPNGMNTSNTKVYETIDAIECGADEIDMMINISALKEKNYDYVKQEIEEIRDAASGHVLKVIIEECLLTDEEIVKMVEICNDTYVNFIKTSTGFDKGGATLHTIDLINEHKSDLLEIKASGGIKTEEDAIKFIEKGVTRIGTSNAENIIKG